MECTNHHKDFCDCVKNSMRIAKKASKTRSVNGVSAALKKACINWEYSQTANVVLIELLDRPNVYLSLIKEKSTGYWKFRISGTGKWQTCHSSKFIAACLK